MAGMPPPAMLGHSSPQLDPGFPGGLSAAQSWAQMGINPQTVPPLQAMHLMHQLSHQMVRAQQEAAVRQQMMLHQNFQRTSQVVVSELPSERGEQPDPRRRGRGGVRRREVVDLELEGGEELSPQLLRMAGGAWPRSTPRQPVVAESQRGWGGGRGQSTMMSAPPDLQGSRGVPALSTARSEPFGAAQSRAGEEQGGHARQQVGEEVSMGDGAPRRSGSWTSDGNYDTDQASHSSTRVSGAKIRMAAFDTMLSLHIVRSTMFTNDCVLTQAQQALTSLPRAGEQGTFLSHTVFTLHTLHTASIGN